jgi:hypothetical protein
VSDELVGKFLSHLHTIVLEGPSHSEVEKIVNCGSNAGVISEPHLSEFLLGDDGMIKALLIFHMTHSDFSSDCVSFYEAREFYWIEKAKYDIFPLINLIPLVISPAGDPVNFNDVVNARYCSLGMLFIFIDCPTYLVKVSGNFEEFVRVFHATKFCARVFPNLAYTHVFFRNLYGAEIIAEFDKIFWGLISLNFY